MVSGACLLAFALVHLQGGFAPSNPPAPDVSVQAWDSAQGGVGSLSYGPFQTGSSLQLWVDGFPNQEDSEKILLRDARGAELRLGIPSPPGGTWARYRWGLPSAWQHRAVTLVAVDASAEPNHWIGVSRPVPDSWRLASAMGLVLREWAVFGLLLLPGLALIGSVRVAHLPLFALTLVLLGSAAAAQACFYAFLLSPRLGFLFAWAALAASAAMVGLRRRTLAEYAESIDFTAPIILAALAAAWFAAGGFLYGGIESADVAPLMRFFRESPPDPLLPHWFAQRLALGQPLRPFFGDWLTSDRPPLQASMNLLLWPFTGSNLGYEALGIAAQSWVWIGLWIFLRGMRVPAKAVAITLGAGLTSWFFFVQTVYCWPKLLPVAFLLCACGLLFGRPRMLPLPTNTALLAAACLAFALLGHGGSAFALVGVAAIWLLQRRQVRWTAVLAGAAAAEAILLPWQGYRHFVDPSAGRLAKWHLAGQIPVDSRPTLGVIGDAYHRLGWAGTLRNKEQSFGYLVADVGPWLRSAGQSAGLALRGHWAGSWRSLAAATRTAQFQVYWLVLGPLWLGLAGFARRRPLGRQAAGTAARLAVATLIVWCLLLFGPDTAIPNSSFFVPAMLLVVASLGLASFPTWAIATLLALNLGWTTDFWLVESHRRPWSGAWYPSAFTGYCLVWLALAAALGAWLLRVYCIARTEEVTARIRVRRVMCEGEPVTA